MGKNFTIKRKLSLAFLGEGWQTCYVNFKPLTLPDLENMASYTGEGKTNVEKFNDTIKILSDHFIDGQGIADSVEVPLESTDLVDLGLEFSNRAVDFLMPSIDPKS